MKFDRVVCISLKRREDRRQRLKKLCRTNGWPFRAIEFFDAVDGGSGQVPAANGFRSGGGAWGCRQSWARVLEQALADNVQSLLVLEDDAMWRPEFTEDANAFFAELPVDWQVAFLGGQNMTTPVRITERVARVRNCQRTHAIAMQKDGLRFVYKTIANADRHIDHILGPACGKNPNAYQATPFLVGQAATQSDISGRKDHARFWANPSKEYPILWLNATRKVAAALTEYGIHYGYDLDQNEIDRGLNKIFPRRDFYAGGIRSFLNTVSWEAASFVDCEGVATIWHPNATPAALVSVAGELPSRVKVSPQFDELEPAIAWLKTEYGDLIKLRKDRRRLPVLLVKSPDNVVNFLREHRFVHFGRWLDNSTQIDRGLISAFSKESPTLESWFRILDGEAREEGLPVGIYHPKATVDVAATCGREVVVVDALTAEEAVEQIEAI